MKRQFFSMAFLCLLSTCFVFVSCDNDDDEMMQPTPNIVEFAQDDPNFSILVDAVVKAGLDGVLSSDGPFTLFAPTNDAFQAFLDAAGTGSVENTPVDVLTAVLTNHVIAAEFGSGDLVNGYVNTLSATSFGSDVYTDLYINVDNGVTINGDVNVTTADVDVSNGVIHVIDQVIDIPTVVTFATADPNFSTLVAALTTSGLTTDFVSVLSGDGPFTVFAPTNTAFQALLDSNPDWNGLSDIPTNVLESVLLYHVTTAGNVRAADIKDDEDISTLNGETFSIDLNNDPPVINAAGNTANIIATDVQAGNGVIHAIDTVILPE